MEYSKYRVDNHIASITLNRPAKHNALNAALVKELSFHFAKAEQDEKIKVIILRAEGQSFCAGADLAYLQQLQKNNYDENLADSKTLSTLFRQIYEHPKVVIAQIQGSAIAGGCGLASICDFSFSVPDAKFGYSEVKIGFVPALVLVYLVQKIGEGKARDLLLSGNIIGAEKAVSIGLITGLFESSELESQTRQFALKLCTQNSSQSMSTVKQMLKDVRNLTFDQAIKYAEETNAKARSSSDCKKGIAAFLNKEKINW